MKKEEIKEIRFKKENVLQAKFDIISFQDLLKKQPEDHSQFDFHKLSFYVIFLITEGSGKYNLNFQEYQYKKATLFTIRKDNIHKFYKSKANGELIVFTKEFILDHSNKLEFSTMLMLFNEVLSSPRIQLATKDFIELKALFQQIKDEQNKINDQYSEIVVKHLIQLIFTKLVRIKTKKNLHFERNSALAHFLNFQINIERHCFKNRKVNYYAEKMKLSSKTLNNVTQQIINKSAKSFINDLFIIRAKRLIINSSDPLTKIAFIVGFDEPTNFFKFFKKQVGISAREFRIRNS